ncbi:hypothetical protein PNEG_00632 [Pneumocystis murina B123]|uniref:Phosphatidate cytidylyltransferase, mitochondrial n=1 Tax=Pneumocystis murina (strain B123) TaxID=1069680 RepID=M7PAY1_PNEMU|nr:hypothetical protein PNEG_00632 [Pneumocystis murina B123]EMR11035.1 hypothetical protein PNEG_00632 [Pneumocystis murina B123]
MRYKNMVYKKLLHFYRREFSLERYNKLSWQIRRFSNHQNLYKETYTTVEKKDIINEKDSKKDFFKTIDKELDQISKETELYQYFSNGEKFKETLKTVLWKFKAPIRFSFAYGSGIFKKKRNDKKPMIDFIFGVSHAQHWHSLNLLYNRDHYSFLKHFGSYFISYLQENIGANVYYNPYIEINDMIIKYGVITIDDLCKELTEWNTLYLSGRMHKPIKILRDEPRVRIAYNINLIAALRLAMLLLPEKFSEYELYSTISKFSYTGDLRMEFAENPYKTEAIVNTQIWDFHQLYFPLINKLPNIQVISKEQIGTTNKILVQDFNPTSRANMIQQLPKKFKDRLYYAYNQKPKYKEISHKNKLHENHDNSFEEMIVKDAHFHNEITKAIETTVRWPSISQSLKGILTGGINKSWRYLTEKIDKNVNAKMS